MTGAARDGLTRAQLSALPAVVDVATAAQALGLGRSTAYELARRERVPLPRAPHRQLIPHSHS